VGAEKQIVRIGGIHELDRIAKDHKEYHKLIMLLLTSFIREKSPLLGESNSKLQKISLDVQTALTTLARRNSINDKEERLDLSFTFLRGADFRGTERREAFFNKASFKGSNLSEAYFSEAHLTEANFSGANLQGADLSKASLRKANFSGANLRETGFFEAKHLEETNFNEADTTRANFKGANLSQVFNLNQAQINNAFRNESTQLPVYLEVTSRL